MSQKTLMQRIKRRIKICWTGRIPEEKDDTPAELELQMVWPASRLKDKIEWLVPEGYLLRGYQPGDEPGFYELMDRAGFPGWNPIEFEKFLGKILPGGFFFAVHGESNTLAATAMALHNPTPLHPFGASLSCVGADPAHQGKGLGYVVSAAVTQRILEAGYQEIYLDTHDWRLPAIKTYLKIGWIPFLFREDMIPRWETVCSELNWPFAPEEWKRLNQKPAVT
jgi:mycothiol synthase